MCTSPDSPEFERFMRDLVECGLAIGRGATDASLFLRRGQALWVLGDQESAVLDLNRAISADPPLSSHDLASAYYRRSICHHQLHEFPEALADATASLSLEERPHTYAIRAFAHLCLGELDQALADTEQALRRDPQDWEARAFRGRVLLAQSHEAAAIEDLSAVIESGACHKYASELHLDRARARLAVNDPSGAEADCTDCIDQDYHEQSHWPFIVPWRAERAHHAYLLRAEARLALGDTTRALGDSFYALSIAAADPACYDMRARVYQAVGNTAEASKDLARAALLRNREDLPPELDADVERFAPALVSQGA